MNSLIYALLMLAVAAFMPRAQAETIVIAGSTTLIPYIQQASEAYRKMHPDVRFTIHAGGSTAGLGEVLGGHAHIGMMSRELNEKEAAHMDGFRHLPVAVDAITPVVSDEVFESGLSRISMLSLAAVYRGEISNWRALGGPDKPILLIDRETYHGTRQVFARYVLNDALAPVANDAVVLEGNADVANIIRASDQAIAYLSLAYLDEHVHALAIETEQGVFAADEQGVKNGNYPLARRLYLVLPKQTRPAVRDFVRFVLSGEGQKLVREAGFIPLR